MQSHPCTSEAEANLGREGPNPARATGVNSGVVARSVINAFRNAQVFAGQQRVRVELAVMVWMERYKMVTRREFLDTLAVGAAGMAIGATAKSYGQILGSNDRLNFALIGLHGRAYAHLSSLKANKDTARVSHVCDVDSDILKKFAGDAQRELGYAPSMDKDFRRILQLKEVDAIAIATPDHWHAPMAIAGLQAGKHVYVEKPRVQCWSRPSRNTASWCRWARSSARRRTPSRLSTRFITA
jgi:hypothetical protein